MLTIGRVFGAILGVLGIAIADTPAKRWIEYTLNLAIPNKLLSESDLLEADKREIIKTEKLFIDLKKQGINETHAQILRTLQQRLFTIEELIDLRHKKEITEEKYLNEIRKLGIGVGEGQQMFRASFKRLPEDVVIRAIWRGIQYKEGRESLIKELTQQGWSEERVNVLEKTLKFYPTPDDFIRFMVRETFDEKVVKTYGYDEDYPVEIENYVKKAGVEPMWMKHFWRAHWVLPSPTMGYEMLQRGIIKKEDLQTLLKIADYPPFWRDALIKISYTPFTRVDIRRMHKMEILKDADLIVAYKDIGYEETKAKQLAEFTIKYNKETTETEDDEIKKEFKGLTISSIIKHYKNNLIDETKARELLSKINLKSNVIDFYIQRANYEKAEEEIELQLKSLRLLYINRIITDEKVEDEIDKLNLPAKEKENLLFYWQVEKETRISKPSKAELTSLLANSIINVDEYVEEMRALGYSDKYIKWYIDDVIRRIEEKTLKITKKKE